MSQKQRLRVLLLFASEKHVHLLWLQLTKGVVWVMQHALVALKTLALMGTPPNTPASMSTLQ